MKVTVLYTGFVQVLNECFILIENIFETEV